MVHDIRLDRKKDQGGKLVKKKYNSDAFGADCAQCTGAQ